MKSEIDNLGARKKGRKKARKKRKKGKKKVKKEMKTTGLPGQSNLEHRLKMTNYRWWPEFQ